MVNTANVDADSLLNSEKQRLCNNEKMEQRISKIMRENDGKLFEVWQERGDRVAGGGSSGNRDRNFSYLYGGTSFEFRSSESSQDVNN